MEAGAGAGGWRITTIKELLLDYHDSFNSFFFFFIYSEFGLR